MSHDRRGATMHVAGGSLVALILGLALLVGAQEPAADKPASTADGATAADELALQQSRVADKYARLEELMIKMASLEEGTNPRRAALLRRAVEQSKEQLTRAELEAIVKLLNQKQLKRALDNQMAVHDDLKALLNLLQSEDRADRLKSEQQRIKEYIKEVERLIRLQQGIQGQTEGPADAKKLAQEQGKVADRTSGLAKKIRETEESQPEEGQPSEDQVGKAPEEGQKSEGQKSEGQKSEGQKSEGQKSEGQKSEGQKSEGQQAEGQNFEGQKAGGQKSEGQKSKGQKSQGQKSQGQQNQGQQDQGQQDQGQQEQQQQGENPARKRLEQAEQKMRDAQRKLEEAKRKESAEDQRQAREELEKAKAELEEILRQMRQEEIARVLADLESRFRRMLEAQLRVYESTRRLDQISPEARGETFIVQAGKLSFDERKIADDAQKALTLLKEEGSSVAFPATVEQMHEDMLAVVERLAETKVDDITIGYEEDIIAALEEMIEALKKAQQDLEQQQQQQPRPNQQPQDQPLVDQLAELKMLKSLQERVNKRTVRYARLLEDDQDPVGQAEGPELVEALKKLGERQEEIFRITRDLVLGKNQ